MEAEGITLVRGGPGRGEGTDRPWVILALQGRYAWCMGGVETVIDPYRVIHCHLSCFRAAYISSVVCAFCA